MHYLDSSAVVKSYINEAGSAWMRSFRRRHQKGELIICEISGAEVFAALHRRSRTGDLSASDLQNACDLFQKDFDAFYTRLAVTKKTVDAGMRLIQKHPLREYDSIPFATAASFVEELRKLDGEILVFVGADKVLNTAASVESLTVINPSEYE